MSVGMPRAEKRRLFEARFRRTVIRGNLWRRAPALRSVDVTDSRAARGISCQELIDARSSETNSQFLWEPSQNGLRAEWPQRQRA